MSAELTNNFISFNRKKNKTEHPTSEHTQREDHFQPGEPIYYDPKYVFRMEPTSNRIVHDSKLSLGDVTPETLVIKEQMDWDAYADMFNREFEKQLDEINALALQGQGTREEAN